MAGNGQTGSITRLTYQQAAVAARIARPLDEELRVRYVERHEDVRTIATALGVSRESVRRWLHAFGIPIRPRGVSTTTTQEVTR